MSAITWICSRAVSERRICTFLSIMRMRIFYTASYQGLTIQPLVENAVVHGLEPRRGLGSVMVRLWEEDSSVCVRVEDDGVGFDPAEVDLEKRRRPDGTIILLCLIFCGG